jgi:mannose-6-phosphate isomerase-like protein (cupin superfamily)
MGSTKPKIVGPNDGESVSLGSIGARFMIDGAETDQGFSLLEHPMPPRHLAAPLHRHSREDEYSYVLKGRLGALLGDEVVFGEPGDLVFKPRDQWHTFWNASDEPASILEIIAPAGFEKYFAELGALLAGGEVTPDQMVEAAGRYGLEAKPETLPDLCAEYDLKHPMVTG